jgi:hypothetical protein
MPRGYVKLFQYGSNMDPERLNHDDRLGGRASVIGVARLDDWGIRFDLFSTKNGCGVTDIVQAPGEHTLGVIYSVPTALVCAPAGKRSKMDRIEGATTDGRGNYTRRVIEVSHHGRKLRAVTYVGTEPGRRRFLAVSDGQRRVSTEYFSHLLSGAERYDFPEDYRVYLRAQADRNLCTVQCRPNEAATDTAQD